MKATPNDVLMRSSRALRGARAAAIAASVCALGALAPAALAGPTGANGRAGHGQVQAEGQSLQDHSERRRGDQLHGFNIGASETVKFIQPNAGSRVLNRVNSNSPTAIRGTLLQTVTCTS